MCQLQEECQHLNHSCRKANQIEMYDFVHLSLSRFLLKLASNQAILNEHVYFLANNLTGEYFIHF